MGHAILKLKVQTPDGADIGDFMRYSADALRPAREQFNKREGWSMEETMGVEFLNPDGTPATATIYRDEGGA